MSYHQVQLKHKIKDQELILPNPNVTLEKSIDCMKKVTIAAVSSILYVRNIFPTTAFTTKKVEGMKVSILRGSHDIPGTQTFIKWVAGAFDAVSKCILKKMILVIEQQNTENRCETLETYTFNFSYTSDAINCQLSSKTTGEEALVESTVPPENIRKAIQDLVRRVLYATQNMELLPEDYDVNLRLEFFDNVPETYQLPDFFKAVDSVGINFPPGTNSLKLGHVKSKFIGIDLRSKSVKGQLELNEVTHTDQDDVDEIQPSQEEPTSFDGSIKSSILSLGLQDSDNDGITSLKRRSTQEDEYCQPKRLKYATNQRQTNIKPFS